jgi:hypothetical protein
MPLFPSLDGFGPTRQTLHLYAHAIGVVPRAHAIAHPKWWHISLKVRPDGLVTDNIALPEGGVCHLRLDPHAHQIVLAASDGRWQSFDMRAGMTGTEMGEAIMAAVAAWGLEGEYNRQRFMSDEPRRYEVEMVGRYFTAVVNAERIFRQHLARVAGEGGEVGPVQVWPHGFDLSGEWFGTRMVAAEEHGETKEFPAQLNLGFYPGDSDEESYFYSNPFPFEAGRLLDRALPAGARWFTESWKGTMLPYRELLDDPAPEARLLAYARAVFEITAPSLMG